MNEKAMRVFMVKGLCRVDDLNSIRGLHHWKHRRWSGLHAGGVVKLKCGAKFVNGTVEVNVCTLLVSLVSQVERLFP